ncbi:MAG: hypothetical protein JRG96_01865 [Deltaproteobacteria bacterium]|nr:hypothetical protein [Deltaproteobacteria bacterium]MBW2417832.1 hypothetical protein [Deltaproteobacteria bacterium]
MRAGVGQQGLSAIAVDPRGGRVAVGDASGAAVGVDGEPFRRVGRALEVNDLFFGSDGALWVGGMKGLWRLAGPERDAAAERGTDASASGARLENRSPGPGELARAVRRIAGARGIIALATAGGVFLSRESTQARSWGHLDAGFPSGPAAVLALRALAEPGVIELWAFAGGNLWRCELLADADEIRVRDLRKVRVPRSPKESVPVDLVADVPGGTLVLVYPDLLLSATAAPGAALAGAGSAPEWTLRRPLLPPGARLRRLAVAGGSFWLASDRGLLRAPSLEGPWWRTSSPAGSVPVQQVAALGDRLFVAAATGLLEGRLGEPSRGSLRPTALALAAAPEELESGPGIRAVQVAALRYAGLGPKPMQQQFRGLARRGWLPVVGVRVGAARDRRRAWDRDEAFVSGDTRHLFDRDEVNSLDLDASLTFAWDFGDVAYEPEYVDLSREARMVIALRDDVLDEVNQLFYERRSIVLQLRTLADPGDAADAVKLALRAAELAAGLDAWTGGWFSDQLRGQAAQHGNASP